MSQTTNVASPDAAAQLDIYRRMLRIERNDDATRKQIRLGRITAPYYSGRGQEVIPSTISNLLTKDDKICTIYRGIHDMVAKDMPLRPLWAEIAGRVDGTCKGKGGPMHLTHPESGVMVTTGIVGSSMPIANGLAWAALLDGSKEVTIAYFGDNDAYMLPGEKDEHLARDPLPAFRAKLIASGVASEEQLQQLQTDIEAEVQDAIDFAFACEFPGVEELRRDVFAEEIPA